MRLPLRLTIALIWLFAFIQTSSAFSHEQAGRLRARIHANGVDTSFTTNKLTAQAANSFIYEPGIDRPLASIDGTSGVATYFHQDALGSIIGLTDSAGVLIEEYRYDAWGAVTVVQAGVVQPDTTVPQSRFLFTGREFDAVTGLYHYRARAYSPKLGRFLQLDPIDFDGNDLNIYRYVANNPINLTDPSGEIAPVAYGVAIVGGVIVKTGIKYYSKKAAAAAAKKGADVLCENRSVAHYVAKQAGTGKRPVGPEMHLPKPGQPPEGQWTHYHNSDRTSGHIFY